jgi:C4-dicarboxylate-specific signal transduction histidine kinase
VGLELPGLLGKIRLRARVASVAGDALDLLVDARLQRDERRLVAVGAGVGKLRRDRGRGTGEEAQEGPDDGKSEGTGLGLPVAARLAAMLGGQITATSELGVGSRFTVRLPVEGLPDGVGSSNA